MSFDASGGGRPPGGVACPRGRPTEDGEERMKYPEPAEVSQEGL